MLYECKQYITDRTTVELMLNWNCDMKIKESPDWCNFVQDHGDQFEWTISHGPTPSGPTGPDHAITGRWFYIRDRTTVELMLNGELGQRHQVAVQLT